MTFSGNISTKGSPSPDISDPDQYDWHRCATVADMRQMRAEIEAQIRKVQADSNMAIEDSLMRLWEFGRRVRDFEQRCEGANKNRK